MTNLTENPVYESGIYQLETTDPVIGGTPAIVSGTPVAGWSNAQAQQLANRTAYLDKILENGIISAVVNDYSLVNYSAVGTDGSKLSSPVCYVYEPDTETLVTTLQDASGAALTNPFTAGANGLVQFAAPNGRYDLRVVKGGTDYRLRVQCNDVAGNVLVSELGDTTTPTKGAAIVGRGVVSLASVSNLQTAPTRADLVYIVRGHVAGTDIGGGSFYWDSTRPKSYHNGTTVISNTVPWDGSLATLTAFLSGTGETATGTNGCFIRTYSGPLDVRYAGAQFNNSADDTAAIQKALAVSQDIWSPNGIARVSGTLNMNTHTWTAASGSEIHHYPSNDTTDCVVITGANNGKTSLRGLTIRGLQGGSTFGRDLLTVNKGDYVVIENVSVFNAKRDCFHAEPAASFFWIENLCLINVKCQVAGRDCFHYELPPTFTDVFINQITHLNCESRTAERHALYIGNGSSVNQDTKISVVSIINGEYSCRGFSTANALVKIETLGTSPIESVKFDYTTVEDVTNSHTGWGVEIVGSAFKGKFTWEGGIVFGATNFITGYDKFPQYQLNDYGGNRIPLLVSNQGIRTKYRTATLAQNASEDVYTMTSGELIKGYVIDRFNNGTWRAEFTAWGGTNNTVNVISSNGVTVTMQAGGVIRVTNTQATSTPMEVFIQRITLDSNA